jgi:MSHA biogenesis protein MshG
VPIFAYKGRSNRGGELVQGTLEGADSSVIADQLLNTGITPTEIKLSKTSRTTQAQGPTLWQRLSQDKKVDPLELMLFSRQMYTLLKSGVPIMRALAGLQESTQNPTFAAMLQDLRESLDSARTVHRDAPPSQDLFAVLSQHGAGRRDDRYAGPDLFASV